MKLSGHGHRNFNVKLQITFFIFYVLNSNILNKNIMKTLERVGTQETCPL